MKRSTSALAKAAPQNDEPALLMLKFSINLPSMVGTKLKETAFHQHLSESSIVEVALKQLFSRISPDVLGSFLRQNGACLRRKP
ncbi:MAG TPA: hypothetical protein VJP76_02460 [Candidatus Tumulicola sp.]|nr:hypothetical protein [Candidatus Tumulicola sp.]